MMHKWVLFGLAATLVGCQLHPVDEYVVPTVTPKASFSNEGDALQRERSEQWWLQFERAELNSLIQQALANNLTVAQALVRVEQASAGLTQAEASLLPSIDLEAGAAKDWQDGEAQRGSSAIGLGSTWQIDLFKELDSAAKAQAYLRQARVEDVSAARLAVASQITQAYFAATAARIRLKLLNAQHRTDKDLLALVQLRKDNGVGTIVELMQQQSRVLDSESLIPLAHAQIETFENRIDVLLGTMPDGIARVPAGESLEFGVDLPALGIPADLLLHRPELRALKAELIAADADIAVAIAQRLPSIRLGASAGFEDDSGFTGAVAALSASFVQPLLDWGQRKAAVVQNNAIYQERLAAFSLAYLEAVEDVENALVNENSQREFLRLLQQRKQVLSDTVFETEARYKQGVDSYLPVLNALQELRDVERDLVNQQLRLVESRIELHRSLGGFSVPAQTQAP